MESERVQQLAQLKFVDNMGALSNKTFEEVFKSNKDFVEFTKTSMSCGEGIFKFWMEFVKEKSRPQHA